MPLQVIEIDARTGLQGLDALDFSFKKSLKKAGKWAKKTVSSPKKLIKTVVGVATMGVTAPITLPAQVLNKASGGKIKPLAKFDKWVGKNEILEAGRIAGGVTAVVGGVVGGAVLAAPAISAGAAALAPVAKVVGGSVVKDVAKDTALNVLAQGATPRPDTMVPPPAPEVTSQQIQQPQTQPRPNVLQANLLGSPIVLVGGALAVGLLVMALFRPAPTRVAGLSAPPRRRRPARRRRRKGR